MLLICHVTSRKHRLCECKCGSLTVNHHLAIFGEIGLMEVPSWVGAA